MHRLLTGERVGTQAPILILRRTEKQTLYVVPEEAPPGR